MYSSPDAGTLLPAGFPIQKFPDHKMFSSSPELIAAYRVFPRLPTPRHPPGALLRLFLEKTSFFPCSIVFSRPLRDRQAPPDSRSLFSKKSPLSYEALVELIGIEPTASGLQSRRSPS